MTESILPRLGDTALVVVDVQERLLPSMGERGAAALARCGVLLELAAEFAWPVVYCEQYPAGLGPTADALVPGLEKTGARRFEKLAFSLARDETFMAESLRSLPNHLIVAGLETHVCVLQTVADLQNRGYQCFVPYDAVCSRSSANHENGLELIRRVGGTVVNVESLLFHALGEAGTPAFRRLAPLIR